MDVKLDRAWMTLGRAVQMSKMLRLDQLDRGEHQVTAQNLETYLPPTTDPLLQEERRRSFWCLYILVSYVRTRTGIKCELGDYKAFEVRLPSRGSLSDGPLGMQAEPMPFLRDVAVDSCPELSSYAGCVLMVDLALRCFDHGWEVEMKKQRRHFWDNHYTLLKELDDRFSMLMIHLNAMSIQDDPVAFSVYMNLRATEVFFHQVAITQVEHQGLPALTAAESQKRSVASALKIAKAVHLNLPGRQTERGVLTLQATFIAWPLVMAAKTLGQNLGASSGTQKRDETSNDVVSPLRLLLAALDHIEKRDGYWHGCIAPVAARLAEWEDNGGFDSVAL
ncbi:hypothetical protein F4778DRAFT_345755 [Xylariomycetidae sp. FL2044]|nr:hypothetical protein F4778DRAFT_345755 [Xylariomycetidae sp. FL2044]